MLKATSHRPRTRPVADELADRVLRVVDLAVPVLLAAAEADLALQGVVGLGDDGLVFLRVGEVLDEVAEVRVQLRRRRVRLGSKRVIQRHFNLDVPRARACKKQRSCFETVPRDDHSSNNQPERVENDPDMNL